MEMKPDIENMPLCEYLEYEAAKERQLWDNVRSRRSPTDYDEADLDSFHHNKNYVAPATKSILDDLLEEFREEILNVTMVDEGADFNPTKDIEELEKLLANDPKSHYIEIQSSTKPYKVDREMKSPFSYTGDAQDEVLGC
ncbi:hypothetical protein Tco_1044570 [Tanacetum coccineum]|uniref:Uncharacterized protein n=1 Tax=Tanacetum coccineum TaxID=301880 RepID=A0ABQ5GR03_9ASTR